MQARSVFLQAVVACFTEVDGVPYDLERVFCSGVRKTQEAVAEYLVGRPNPLEPIAVNPTRAVALGSDVEEISACFFHASKCSCGEFD